MDPITRRNAAAQERAQARGLSSFTREVVDHWPACSTCGETIRHVGRGERTCHCPGVTWRFTGVVGRSPERIEPPRVEPKRAD